MHNDFALWALLAWFPIVMALVWGLGTRKAAPIAILGGYLFLPIFGDWDYFRPIVLGKRMVPGLAFLLAALIFDRRTMLRARPSWLDLPMVLFVINPLAGSAWHRFDQLSGSIEQTWLNLTEWALPYLIARIYFADADGPRRLAGSIVVGGLVYLPICWFEATFGPTYYLAGRIYGIPYYETMVVRLGGFRPDGFLGNGIELATWMALTSVMAAWLWLSFSGWKLFGWPAWLSGVFTAALVAISLLCRGVYGYAEMFLGLAATAITLGLRTKAFLIILLFVPPVYVVARSARLYDGKEMLAIAAWANKEGTIAVRLEAEDRVVKETVRQDFVFGFGGEAPYWDADGWWLTIFKGGGLVGLVTQYGAFFFPVALTVFAWRRRVPARSAEVGLALIVILVMIDSLHNTSPVAAVPLIGGTLISSVLAGGLAARASKKPSPGLLRSSGRVAMPVALVVTVMVLAVVEILGRLPRSHRVEVPVPKADGKP